MRVVVVQDLTALEKEERATEFYQLGVRDLRLSQLQMLKLDHASLLESDEGRSGGGAGEGKLHVVSEETMDDEIETASFPTLRQVLDLVPPNAGFNIEIKSPLMCLDGTWETEQFWERNLYVDAILQVVLANPGARRIVFSSFDPDICNMIKMKQNRFPVLFLTQGKTQRYVPFHDKRANTSLMAVAFAAASNILGVNFHSEELLRDSSPLYAAQNQGLVSFVWGDDLDDKDALRYFRQLAVDGLIYDRIHDKTDGKPNIFLVEKQQRDVILKWRSKTSAARDGETSHPDLVQRSSSDLSNSPSPPPLSSSVGSTHKFTLSPPEQRPTLLSPPPLPVTFS